MKSQTRETLRQRLHRSGKLLPEEALKIALGVCRELRAAHKKEANVQAIGAIVKKDVPGREHLIELRKILNRYFDKGELKVLCFDLGVQYEDLPEEKSSMAVELVAYFERYNRIPELVKAIRKQRPNIPWSHTPDVIGKVPSTYGNINPDNILFDQRGEVKIVGSEAYVPHGLGEPAGDLISTLLYQTPQLLLGELQVQGINDIKAHITAREDELRKIEEMHKDGKLDTNRYLRLRRQANIALGNQHDRLQKLLSKSALTFHQGVQSDLYAVVVVLYEMLCGSFITKDQQVHGTNFYLRTEASVLDFGTLSHLFRRRALLVLPQERDPSLPRELNSIFSKGLAYKPADRYQTVEELISALQEVLNLDFELPSQEFPPPYEKLLSDELIQTIVICLRHGRVPDPWDEENPYNLLEEFLVGPRSSIQETRGHSSDRMTKSQRAAWKQLQDPSSRLFVDSFLYRVDHSEELVALVKSLASDQRLPPIEQVPSSLRKEWPTVLLLAGRRDDCLTAWADIRRTAREPSDPNVTHSLAVAYTFLAQGQEKDGQIDAAVDSWRRAIANWVWILSRDDFWAELASNRSRHYQVQITPRHISNLHEQLGDYFGSRFSGQSRVLPPDCPAETRQAYTALSLAWHIERAGLQALKLLQESRLWQTAGPVAQSAGPLLVSELGLEESLARFVLDCTEAAKDIVALLTSSLDVQKIRQNIQKVRLYYSQLGQAAAWLDRSQPERALTAISVAGEGDDFDRLNPSYRLLPDKRLVWEKDRVELVMRVHLQLANKCLQCERWDVEQVVNQWTEVISQSAPVNNVELAMKMIGDQALTYLRPIADDPGKQRQQRALAEAVRRIITISPDLAAVLQRLRGQAEPIEGTGSQSPIDLATLLQSSPHPGPSDTAWQERIEKLYAVLRVNPDDEEAREQLLQLLVQQLERLVRTKQIEAARQIVDEWYVKLDQPALLQELRRYLRHGHKIAMYLPQTDLAFIPSLVESHTYRFEFELERVDVIVKLTVEGDLVRIFAPLPLSAHPLDTDNQRNLLSLTQDMPLFQVYHKPDGEYGLMVETLAHALTPALLEQLIRSLAYRVDLSETHLQSLSALQQELDDYEPDLSLQAGELPTERDFERWQSQLLTQCRRMDLECTLPGGFAYRLKRRGVTEEPIQLNFQVPVVTLQARIGDQYRLDRRLYERMMDWNYATRLCKLVLAPDSAVMLRCEVLDLDDEEAVARILDIVFEGLTQSTAWLTWHIL